MKEFNITAQEVSIDTHGLSFLCVFGTHINGGWCAILNFGVSCELATNSDSTASNAAEIAHALACCPYDKRSWLPKSGKDITAIAIELSNIITQRIAE